MQLALQGKTNNAQTFPSSLTHLQCEGKPTDASPLCLKLASSGSAKVCLS